MKKDLFSYRSPHDRYLKRVLRILLVVRETLKIFLPAEQLALLNLATLELSSENFVGADQREVFSDLVYTCETINGEPVRICLLFEHKSSPPGRHLYVQLENYLRGMQEEDIRQEREYFTLTIPILFYHGESPLRLGPLREQYGPVSPVLAGYIPHFDIICIDVQALSDEMIERMCEGLLLRQVLLALKHIREAEYIRLNFRRMFIFGPESEDEVSLELFEATLIYVQQASSLKKEEIMNMVQTLPPAYEQRAKSAYEEILEEGFEKGREKGFAEGRELGREEGRKEG
ncbi:MAG: Rpn family recombination-promoting nuclease/putative transposase, partial [Saprospiraceae bacterium]|nr:Rpn family recombination-promoting nuclease/putative transposase [Saprospiraceae bacterium]